MYSLDMRTILLLLFLVFPVNADQHIIEQENFEAWQFACVEEQSQKICDLRELVFDQNTEEVVSYLSITINPDSLAQMQIAFPHAVNLKNSVQLQIDENDPLELNYAYCNQSACFIAEIIADNFINMFKAGNQITLKVLLLDNREATITYSVTCSDTTDTYQYTAGTLTATKVADNLAGADIGAADIQPGVVYAIILDVHDASVTATGDCSATSVGLLGEVNCLCLN